ncbi:uncharacterized protein [Diabrotica undecimpunctata]|uniref:uncharacterized protein isoform X2 n=1 Tax=Diabrotica undecimpunctata TaxID=50387 RepID=UPI003B63F447
MKILNVYDEMFVSVLNALKRVVRNTIGEFTYSHYNRLKTLLVRNCVVNGFTNIENDLQKTFKELETCVLKKKLLVDNKDDYIKNMEDCSQEPIKAVKNCLSKKKGYLPNFLLNMARKQVELIYDDREIINMYLAPCTEVFESFVVAYKYRRCLVETSKRTNDTEIFADSVETFCSRYLPSIYCLTDIINEVCSQDPKLKQYIEDHIKAKKYPCEQKYD